MKTKQHFIKGTILASSLLVGIGVQAQTIAYTSGIGANGDVLVCFRPAAGTGSYDLVADAGSVSTFTNLSSGSSITIDPNFYTGTLLSYIGTNNIYFSAMACERISGAHLTNNVWITRARTVPAVQSTAWPCEPAAVQGNAASQIDSIGNDAVNIADQVTTPFGTSPAGSGTAIVEPEGGINGAGAYFNSYSFLVNGANNIGNLGGTFWGDSKSVSVEQSTPTSFTTSGQPVYADFYQLNSTTNSGATGQYLGYFKLNTNGVLTYTAGPLVVVVPPPITSIVRSGNITTIQFTSQNGFSYTLLGTNDISAPRATWPALGSPVTGNGSTQTFTDTTTDGTRYYTISAH